MQLKRFHQSVQRWRFYRCIPEGIYIEQDTPAGFNGFTTDNAPTDSPMDPIRYLGKTG